jgi:uncharacterized GH25 family protein
MVCVLLAGALATALTGAATAHELWIETAPTAESGAAHAIDICWGHLGERATGTSLAGQADKISVRSVAPDGNAVDLTHTPATDCFAATHTLAQSGYHVFGASLETGILREARHSIPANTRMIMFGKTWAHVPGGSEGLQHTLGHDLEIVVQTPAEQLRPGSVVRAQVLLHGKPFGGKDASVTLSTMGPTPLAEDPGIESHLWSTTAYAQPRDGEVVFPLIAPGQHQFTLRYLDPTPGVYDGDRDDDSSFSHLRKGDKYDAVMYVATFTIQVQP